MQPFRYEREGGERERGRKLFRDLFRYLTRNVMMLKLSSSWRSLFRTSHTCNNKSKTIHLPSSALPPSPSFFFVLPSIMIIIFSSADTTIAELLKVVTDRKLFRETTDILWTTVLSHWIIMLSVCLSTIGQGGGQQWQSWWIHWKLSSRWVCQSECYVQDSRSFLFVKRCAVWWC